jgi:hypothetical protein
LTRRADLTEFGFRLLGFPRDTTKRVSANPNHLYLSEGKSEMTAPTRITRTIIDRDGALTPVRTIEAPYSGLGLTRSPAVVDLAEIARADLAVAIKHLIKMIRTCDPATRQMLEALHVAGRSRPAFQYLADVKNFSDKTRTAFRAIWTECGHRIRREVGDDIEKYAEPS